VRLGKLGELQTEGGMGRRWGMENSCEGREGEREEGSLWVL
jgi:hypothetical protein